MSSNDDELENPVDRSRQERSVQRDAARTHPVVVHRIVLKVESETQ